MRRALAIALILAGATALWGFRQLRQDAFPSSSALPNELLSSIVSISASSLKGITLTVEKSRRGDGPVEVQWLSSVGEILGQQQLRDSLAALEFIDGTRYLKITSPGHEQKIIDWPERGHRHVALLALGDDRDLFAKAPDEPSTTGPVDCALRLMDAQTNRLIAEVQFFLDKEFIGTSGTVGEFSVAFSRLKQARQLTLKHPQYLEHGIELTPGRIDELQILPLRLQPKIRFPDPPIHKQPGFSSFDENSIGE